MTEQTKNIDEKVLVFKQNTKKYYAYKEFHDIIKHRIIHAVISYLNLNDEEKEKSDLINITLTKDEAIEIINSDEWNGLIPKSIDSYTSDCYQLIKPKISLEYDNLEYFQAIIEYKPGDDLLKIFALDIPDSIVVNVVKGLMSMYMENLNKGK